MKKWLIYLLLFTYLSSFNEVRQVVKMPRLIEHYISHIQSNNEMSLYAFFKMHYIDEHVPDSDYLQDMKLPFKTHDFSNLTVIHNIPPEKETITFHHYLMFVDYSNNFSYSEKYYPLIFQNIWEPPKI